MEQFLLLGQIPGTTIQISFGDWLIGFILLALPLGIRRAIRHHEASKRQRLQKVLSSVSL